MVEATAPYGSCETAGWGVAAERSRRANMIARRMVMAGALVLVSTLVAVALVHSVSEPTVLASGCVSDCDVAQQNLDRSDQLLDKVKSLLDQEQKISTAVREIESAPLLAEPAPQQNGAASAASAAPAPAASSASSGSSSVASASGASAAASGGVDAGAGGSAGSASAVSAEEEDDEEKERREEEENEKKEAEAEARAVDQRVYYSGFVGGSMSDQDPKSPPEKPEARPGVFDETKKARFIMVAIIFIAFVAGTFALVRSLRNGSASTVTPSPLPPRSQGDLEYGGSPSTNLGTQSARDKLAAVQEQYAATRRQLAEQQQRLALAQSQLSHHAEP